MEEMQKSTKDLCQHNDRNLMELILISVDLGKFNFWLFYFKNILNNIYRQWSTEYKITCSEQYTFFFLQVMQKGLSLMLSLECIEINNYNNKFKKKMILLYFYENNKAFWIK